MTNYEYEQAQYEELMDTSEARKLLGNDQWKPLPSAPIAPLFHLEWLPKVLRDMAEAVAANLSVPVDLPAIIGLGAASACGCGRVKVHIRDGWEEPCQLFVMGVMGSGEGKSPTFKKMTDCLFRYQAQENQRREIQIALDGAAVETLQAQKAQAIRKGHLNEAKDLARQIAEAPVMHPMRRFIGGDATPEAIPEIMQQNSGATAILDDEGELLELLAGRYQERPNLDAYLKGYTGSALSITRRGRSIVVEHPALAVLLLVQPFLLNHIFTDGRMTGKGLVARFLISCPEPLREYGKEPAIPPDVISTYENALLAIADTQTRTFTLSPEAYDLFMAFRDEWRQRQWGDWEPLKRFDFIGKLSANAARMACVLALWESEDDVITAAQMRNAIAMIRYFIGHVLHLLGDGCTLSKQAQDALAVLIQLGQPMTKERELKRKLQQRKNFPTAESIDAALDELAKAGYLRRTREIGSGHTAAVIELHPELLQVREEEVI